VAHDPMFGVGAGCFDTLLAGTRCRVSTFRGEADPLFGGVNPEPIPRNYGTTSSWLRRNPQDICLVTDGDADRIGGLDGRGNPLTAHQIICLLIEHFAANRGERGRVVKSINTTSMVDALCAAHGLPLQEVGIGFKYIAPELLEPAVLLGVEESGSIGYRGHLPERDGIASGLWLLELLATRGRSVGQLLGE
ncbi:MAG: phosphoglucomutase/phosphomannomutase family protein, partial [Verrucomicrobiae bacterium]|nr:phosphoglucomutase/phosphomannomutase family protein [Verrucomicrobiae bacterium]